MKLDSSILARVAGDDALWRDFETLCDFGGRLTGTPGEAQALDFVARAAAQALGAPAREIEVAYDGWTATRATLRLEDGAEARCCPLLRGVPTPPGGLEAEVIDLGRGAPEEFAAHAGEIAGRIALVRHELMFAAGVIPRWRKYRMAREAGAVGFLIAAPIPASLVAGDSGRDSPEGLPALGVTQETAARLRRRAGGYPTVRMLVETREAPARSRTILAELPGAGDEWVALSAHVDGHALGESAMDNASGVAAALSAARALAPAVARQKRGLRLMFFSVEEWGLVGSARYVESLSPAERARLALNVNLDSVAGSPDLAALTSGFAGLEPFLLAVAEANGHALRAVRPLMMNSDHANFALAGVPAFRLVAGFDQPAANLRMVLTEADTRDKVSRAELRAAAELACAITAAALDADEATAARWRELEATG